MGQYTVFRRAQDLLRAFKSSAYPWAAFLFPPLWAFRSGLPLHGTILVALYAACAVLIVVATNGSIGGVTVVGWLSAFTAYNATMWLTYIYQKQGYKMAGCVEAPSHARAPQLYREPKRHRVVLDRNAVG